MTKNASKIGSLLLYGDCSAFRDFYHDRFELFDVIDKDGAFFIRDAWGASIAYPPQAAIALIAPTELESAAAERLRDWLAANSLDIAIAVHRHDLCGVLDRLATRMARLADGAASHMRQLAALRTIHEQLQNSYDNLRSYIAEHAPAIPSAAFVNPPDSEPTAVAGASGAIYQPLPVEFRALCGVSLYVETPAAAEAEGFVELQLFPSDQNGHRVSWKTPFAQFQPGWVNFVFEQSGLGPRGSAALQLTVHDGAGAGPVFALGARPFRADKSAVVDGAKIERALALKAWTSIPGAPLGLARQMWPAMRLEAGPVSRLEVGCDKTLDFVDVLDLNNRFGLDLIETIQDCLSVHPLPESPAIAELTAICPPHAVEVMAEVETMHEQGAPVEYAILPRPDGLARDASLDELVAASAKADWVRLPARTPGVLRVAFDRPLAQPRDLWLMTRLPPDTVPVFCWARFKRLTFKGDFSGDLS